MLPHIKKSRTRVRLLIFLVFAFLGLNVLSLLGKHCVSEDTKNQRASDGCDGDLTKGERKTADTGDEDRGNNKEVSVVAKVNLLDHLQT